MRPHKPLPPGGGVHKRGKVVRKKNLLRELAREVMANLKARNPSLELHHVFGRTGRLLACERFIRPLSPDDHRGKEAWQSIERLRDNHRWDYLAMQKANHQNREDATCWWSECEHRTTCPLYEEV